MSTALIGWYIHWRLSPAKEAAERRLGRGRNDTPTAGRRRFCDCGGGASALRTRILLAAAPPPAEPVETTADGGGGEGGEAGLLCPWLHGAGLRSLWRLHWKEPG